LIGYRGPINADGVEWLFELEATAPLLHWLSHNLHPSDALTDTELAQYEELKAKNLVLSVRIPFLIYCVLS
jgi:hypothetical protein